MGSGVEAGASVVGGAASTATAAVSGMAAAGKTASSDNGTWPYFVDALFRRTDADASRSTASTSSADESGRTAAQDAAEATRIFMNFSRTGPLPPDDLRYVAQLVSQRTGLSQQEAERRVADVYARAQTKLHNAEIAAREAADQARKASAYAALWMFISLLIGAFVASVAATCGGRQRDS
jgi:hypothetical protein